MPRSPIAALIAAVLVTLVPACAERSVMPGINQAYFDRPDPEAWATRFEVESREIYSERHRIRDAAGLQPGQTVADIGAGTGLFVPLFAEAVGPRGSVVAVEIQPGFLAHIEERARKEGLEQVRTHLGGERSAGLPESSIDAAFICDTYHHFEYPRSMMASIHEALRPGGALIVIDFHRIEGKSREWILGHVRAGEEVFRAEIEQAGFRLVERLDFLEENYFLRFERVP